MSSGWIYEKEKQYGRMVDILSHIVEFEGKKNGERPSHVLHIHFWLPEEYCSRQLSSVMRQIWFGNAAL